MAESFDMWLYPKCKNGYARFFREWADKDITNLVLANRNHPSIVMWSIGNEIPEQWSEEASTPHAPSHRAATAWTTPSAAASCRPWMCRASTIA